MPADEETQLRELLQRLPVEERAAWMEEVERLERIVAAYEAISPKQRYDRQAGAYRFKPEVLTLCQQARCSEPIIVKREPHRARPPSSLFDIAAYGERVWWLLHIKSFLQWNLTTLTVL